MRVAFQQRLETHESRTAEVDLVEEQDSTLFGSENGSTVNPDGIAIDQTETADQIGFVSLTGDVDTEASPLRIRRRLAKSSWFFRCRKVR